MSHFSNSPKKNTGKESVFLSRNRFGQYNKPILNFSLRKQLILSLRLNIWYPLSDPGSIPICSEKRIFGALEVHIWSDFMDTTNSDSEILGPDPDYYIIKKIKIYLYLYMHIILYYIYFI